MGNDEFRLSVSGLRDLAERVFCAYGMPAKNAKIVADCLVTADLRGVASHGIVRVKSYLERARKENWNADPVFKFSGRGAVCVMDGDDGFGSLVGTAAMEKAIELAKIHGVGVCSVRRSSHFGMAAYYPLMAAKQDMIGFCCTNSVSNLAPFGAKQGMLGTSPFAIAAPVQDKPPIALDVSCSVSARGRITNAKREGKSIPLGWAIDKDGNPTTDPAAALVGAILPLGGHKGSGMSMIMDVLCGVLNGGSTAKHVREDPDKGPGIGHFFLALDISAFEPLDEFKARAKTFVEEVKTAEKAPGVEEIFVPGEQADRRIAYNLEHGIPVGAGAMKELCEVSEKYGIGINPYDLIVKD